MRTVVNLLAMFVACVWCVLLYSCDDTTDELGTEIMPDHDNISTSTETFTMPTRTLKVDSVLANTSTCYLGCVVDPETRAKTTCDFLAQFHIQEKFQLPNKSLLKDGTLIVDSCDIRIYFDDFYGDSLTSMKLLVHELDTNNVMKEGINYYTNINPEAYVNQNSSEKISLTYAVKDLTRPTNETDGSSYYRSIRVQLSKQYGEFLVNKYYESPEYFKNSYQFINHVCPGFYFKIVGGVGSMVETVITTLNVYFSYKTVNEAGRDTIVDGMQRMAATEEVLQNTRVENKIPDSMLDETLPYAYVKSPSSLCTELTLPLSDIVAGGHYLDTINSASFTLRCVPQNATNAFSLTPPPMLLLIRKSEQFSFFENSKLIGSDAYVSSYNQQLKAYTFNDISQLIKRIKDERDLGAGVQITDSEEIRNQKYKVWEANRAEWNKLVVLPVKGVYTTTESWTGSTQTLVKLKNELGLHSVKLEGGDRGVELSVIYSSFNSYDI